MGGKRTIGTVGFPHAGKDDEVMKTVLLSLALVALIGFSRVAMDPAASLHGQPEERPTLRLYLGMPTEDFARQAIAVQPRPIADPIQIVTTPLPEALSSMEPGQSIIRQPHRLVLEVNGHTFTFDGGGGTAATWVTNMPRISDQRQSGPIYDRINSIRFDLDAELVSLSQAISSAAALCRDMRQAGLETARADWPLASVYYWNGPYREVRLDTFADVQRIFLDPVARAETVGACRLAHADTSFELEIRNYRRARDARHSPEEIAANEEGRATERAYRVSGALRWIDAP
jgi:hypothetical protein